MYLSKSNITELRAQVEENGSFNIAIAPMQSETFLNVEIATNTLYKKLVEAGLRVLVDDRNQKPKNKFEVINLLRIPHRVVISSRSISAGVYEYRDLETDYFEKVPEGTIKEFLMKRISD